MYVCKLCMTENGHRTDCPTQKTPPPDKFPPHWLMLFRINTSIIFQLQPCNVVIPAAQWRLFPDGLRALDIAEIIPMLAKVPSHHALVICYVDSIDSAHYLMEACNAAVSFYDSDAREKLFNPNPQTHAPGPTIPSEPLPAGHPDSFPMDALRSELAMKPNDNKGTSPCG